MAKKEYAFFYSTFQFLEKKVPKNPKYQTVKAQLKTGKTMNDVEIISM